MPSSLLHLTQQSDHINFFWTGKIPPSRIFKTIGIWQRYLSEQKSDFTVRLWISQQLYRKLKQHFPTKNTAHKCFITYQTGSQKLTIEIKNFAPILKQARKKYPELCKIYQYFIDNNLRSFASSFARTLILNSHPGFYCDCDILPRKTVLFPKSLTELQQLSSKTAPAELTTGYYNGTCEENQVMLAIFAGGYTEILAAEEKNQGNASLFKSLVENTTAYLNVIKKIKKKLKTTPLFTQEKMEKGLEYLHSQNMPSHLQFELNLFASSKEQKAIAVALRHFQLFYILSIKNYDYEDARKTHPALIERIQSCFCNPTQDRLPVYSWSHPIYYHLLKLQSATQTISAAYNRYKTKQLSVFMSALKTNNLAYFQKNHHMLSAKQKEILLRTALKTDQYDILIFLMSLDRKNEAYLNLVAAVYKHLALNNQIDVIQKVQANQPIQKEIFLKLVDIAVRCNWVIILEIYAPINHDQFHALIPALKTSETAIPKEILTFINNWINAGKNVRKMPNNKTKLTLFSSASNTPSEQTSSCDGAASTPTSSL